MFEANHFVQFYETDLMGIVHHSNYVRFFEEARVAWAIHRQALDPANPESAAAFAVTGVNVRYLKPCKFGDQLRIQVQARLVGVRLFFEYKLWRAGKTDSDELASEARTEHASLTRDLKLQRPSSGLKELMKGEAWNETWLLSL